MNDSQPDKNHLQGDELGKMISLHLDSRITDEQFAQLQYTLEVDESARDFYIAFISTHARLEQSLKNTFSIKNQAHLSDKDLLNELSIATPRPSRRIYFTLLGVPLVTLLIICVLIITRVPPSYATVSDAHQAKISQKQQLSIGNRLETQASYTLERGHLELLFNQNTMGAKLGPHQVFITTYREFDHQSDPNQKASPELSPAKYHSKSELTTTVKAGDNQIPFDLESK
ncbi:hypothetical protein [uncultured Gimesia sp.]|uniref:hypothetical protein n=1 Tax=uncultured Gimesia sp. TaxID=1678688 RepID=UPI0030D7C723|tara:strand:- start:34555 stop:35241 length:687 start_codon:yes stop_codon:yes gene_type:complete